MHQEKNKFRDFILITAGCTLLAFGVKAVLEPNGLVIGGVPGIAVLAGKVAGRLGGSAPLWAAALAVNVPVLAAACCIKGLRRMRKTIFSALFFAFMLAVLPRWGGGAGDPLVTAVLGGLFCGGGTGLLLTAGAETGGTETLAELLYRYLPRYGPAQIRQALDCLIVLAGAYYFGVRNAVYAAIGILLATKVSDAVIGGLKYEKLAYIISDRYEAIGQAVRQELGCGAAGLCGKEMQSRTDMNILVCMVAKKEIAELRELVYKCDPYARVIISEAREAPGEGFAEYRRKER